MAEHGMETILTLGAVAVGGYFLYNWLTSSSTTTTTTTTTPPATTPGTTPTQNQTTGGQTSVSTAPPSTPAPTTTMQTLAANMQSNLGLASANADQWNYAFQQIMGEGIDTKYGFSFDTVYGAVVNGVRNNGATMGAMTFLQLAASAVPGGLPGLQGLGARLHYSAQPVLRTTGNMIYANHHPLPYAPSYSLFRGVGGLGAYTMATGFERALWTGLPLNRRFQ